MNIMISSRLSLKRIDSGCFFNYNEDAFCQSYCESHASGCAPRTSREFMFSHPTPLILLQRRHLWSRTDEQEIAERKEQPASPPPTANTGRYTNTSDKVNERTETEDADAIDGPLKSKGRSGRETLSEEDVRADKAEDPIKR